MKQKEVPEMDDVAEIISKISEDSPYKRRPTQKRTWMTVPEMGKLLGLKKTDRYWLVHKNVFESCQRNGMCVLKDDVADIMAKVKDAEVIVYATPIYYYEMCGQMKTLLDRLNPLYSTDYSFRDIYMIATAAENDESAFEKAYNGLQGWVDCFEKASLKGMVGGGGMPVW